MEALTGLLRESAPFLELRRILHTRLGAAEPEPVDVTGLHGSAQACLLASLRQALPEETAVLCVLPSQTEARKLHHDLATFGLASAGFYPLLPDILGEGATDTRKILRAERIEAADILHRGGTVVTSIHALAQKVPPGSAVRENTIRLSVGETHDFTQTVGVLNRVGYRRVDTVELKGEFAVRGGIMDVFPLTHERPVRFEFFGDEIESIRRFDETTQRSTVDLPTVTLLPPREFVLTEDARTNWLVHTNEQYAANPSHKLRANMESLTEELFETGSLSDVEEYYPLLFPDGEPLAASIPGGTLIYANEPRWMERELTRFADKLAQMAEDAREEGRLAVAPEAAFADHETTLSLIGRLPMVRTEMSSAGDVDGIAFGSGPIVEEKGNLQRFLAGVEKWTEEDYTVTVVSESSSASDQMREVLRDHELMTPNVHLHTGWLSEGFAFEALRQVVIPQDAVFGTQHRSPQRQSKMRDGRPLLSLVDLQEGDYVVHVTHGIGKYAGIKRLETAGEQHDFLTIQYAGADTLHIPTYNINLIEKYIGPRGEKGVALDRLGGVSWGKVKSRVKKSVEDLAEELIKLYAERDGAPGRAFSADTTWQKEFEAAFPFDETPDQLTAIEEIKEDLERPRPMDRLVCGDVGYGKTEVALRAVFKVVMDGAQVAILVPTTVLAQQHFYTLRERFREFPVQTRMLSRLTKPEDSKQAIEGLEKGTVDVVVGTHRLLSKGLKFRNLGLLVIDEEHRFGVKQKERLRQIKKQVDTVTLTATPIPRTLHMAMTGVRDLTVITTPPENRLPIDTQVMAYSPDMVREATQREMSRGGQVFFVHNRVQGIESIAQNIQTIVPQARVAVAHGQMGERDLEDVMLRFIRHEYDVLVCTTIIESGLDIPNVNTILINRADALGLAQLYQLRGRVGRSDRRAYGYLFYPEDRVMTEESQKRLRVIEEFTELGSGFKIALHDMEIRGAGNLLGPEQHGHIAAVGYDLYCKLLEAAIAERKGEPVLEDIDTKITLPVSAFLPDDYVADGSTKMALYKKMAAMDGPAGREELEAEMRDRYGALPEPARALLDISLVKSRAARMGITAITVNKDRLRVDFDEQRTDVDPERILELMQRRPTVTMAPPASLICPTGALSTQDVFAVTFDILDALAPGNAGDIETSDAA